MAHRLQQVARYSPYRLSIAKIDTKIAVDPVEGITVGFKHLFCDIHQVNDLLCFEVALVDIYLAQERFRKHRFVGNFVEDGLVKQKHKRMSRRDHRVF